jgi:hypothetical protein
MMVAMIVVKQNEKKIGSCGTQTPRPFAGTLDLRGMTVETRPHPGPLRGPHRELA